MAHSEGFEPPTNWFEAPKCIQTRQTYWKTNELKTCFSFELVEVGMKLDDRCIMN